ncbi:MAG TPA: sulfatase [Candidatus Synoicihabitans sp.]|nr:sulfatase [Candidatus Synoicihabitans sp.]
MPHPNLLFVFSDQQRRHALGFMHEDPVRTPHLDDFAAESAVCINAVACCPICTPNRSIILTGRYPTRTGVFANDHGLQPGTPTIGDYLQAAGYWTGYVGKWHIHDGGNFVPRSRRAGFDFWHATNCNHETFTRIYWEEDPQPVVNEMGWQPPHETSVAIEKIRHRPKDRPFALFLSWTPPHNTHGPGFTRHPDVAVPADFADEMRAADYPLEMQYHAPGAYVERFANQTLSRRGNVADDYAREALPGYFGACESLDHEFGRLLAVLDEEGLSEDTIVVYTSDHGEMLGSHGRIQKSVWFEESIGVPLLVRWPRHIRPAQHSFVFSSLDWARTLLGLVDASLPSAGLDGGNHSAALLSASSSSSRESDEGLLCYFAMRRTQMEESPAGAAVGWRALRTGQHTYVVKRDRLTGSLEYLLYDLAADPLQMNPRCGGAPLDRSMHTRQRNQLGRVDDPFIALL